MIKIESAGARAVAAVIGHDVDGEVIADVFEVVAEAADGRRWVHFLPFPTLAYSAQASAEAGEPVFVRVDAAQARAERFAARVQAAGAITSKHWAPTLAAYGSQAHDEGELLAAEVDAAMVAGEISQHEAGRVLSGAR